MPYSLIFILKKELLKAGLTRLLSDSFPSTVASLPVWSEVSEIREGKESTHLQPPPLPASSNHLHR